MKRCVLLILSLVALTLAAPTPGNADNNVIRVAFNVFPPSKVVNEDGTYGGTDIALLRLVAERMGLRVQCHKVPFKRGLKMIEYGDLDLSVGVLHRPKRAEYAHFLSPPYISKTNKAFYVLKGKSESVRCYEDLMGLKVGTQMGTMYFPRFDNDKAIDKHEVADSHLNIRMLRAGRIDTFISSEHTGDRQLSKLGLTDVIVKAHYAYSEPQDVFMILSKQSPLADRLDEFNRTLRELLEAGAYERIKDKALRGLEP